MAEGPGLPPTLLPLPRYSTIMQINPSHFHQLAGAKAPLVGGCDDIWDQRDREELAWTMQQAERMIAEQLGFWPAPKFIEDEDVPFGLMGVRSDWQNAEAKTEWKRVSAFGTEKLTLVQAGATVSYSDDDNDPFVREETATIGTALYADLAACGGECEVAVFFRVADGAVDAADPMFEIRPLRTDIDGTIMRITGESSLFVKPTLWNLTRNDCRGSNEPDAWKLDWDLDKLVTQVDVYCRTVDPQTPITVKWDGVCTCTSPCSHYTQLACAYVTDLKRGFFAPRLSTWNGTTHVGAYADYSGPPESLTVNYRSGYPLGTHCRMDPLLERAIVKLTNVLLPEPPCGFCDAADTMWKNDRKDVDPLTPEAAGLPWALYQQGALDAWKIVSRLAAGQSGKLGR